MANFNNLRAANIARQAEWDRHDKIDLPFRMNELAGEAGELCNVLKKIYREQIGIAGTRATKDQLADELADVVICVDLCAMTAGIESDFERLACAGMADAVENMSLIYLGCRLAHRVGAVCAWRPTRAPVSSANELRDRLLAVSKTVRTIAVFTGIDMWPAVSTKFNATSHRVHLTTTLRETPD